MKKSTMSRVSKFIIVIMVAIIFSLIEKEYLYKSSDVEDRDITTTVYNNQNNILDYLQNRYYFKKGDVLLFFQRFEDAISAYDIAIKYQPEDSWAYNRKGFCLERLLNMKKHCKHLI
jgi:tetratricopeptide (TPR) repeat protein